MDLNSLYEQGEGLYNNKLYTKAKSYLIQARNSAIQMQKIVQHDVFIFEFVKKCECLIGKCQANLEDRVGKYI